MVKIVRMSLVTAVLLITAHRLPAPIQEVTESPTPESAHSATPRPKRTAESKVGSESPEPTSRKATPSSRTQPKPSNVESVGRETKQKRNDKWAPNDRRALTEHSATAAKRFAGTWSGTMHEESGRTYPVTVVIDQTETKAIANGPLFANEEGRIQINGDTLTWNWMLDSWTMTLRTETTAQLVKRYFSSTHTGSVQRIK